MKNILKMVLLLSFGLFFVACGDSSSSSSEGFSKSGRAGSLDVTYSSAKPLVVGDNSIKLTITKDGEPLKDAEVEFKVFMPEMPGMPYMEDVVTMTPSGDGYVGSANFSMAGTWQVKIYIQKDGKRYKHASSVIL